MLIDELLPQILSGGQKDHFAFETFVLNLLKYHLESQNKPFQVRNSIASGFGDAVADEGFDDFNGKTLIEIKYNLRALSLSFAIEQNVSGILLSTKKNDYKYLLFIIPKPSRIPLTNLIEKVKQSADIEIIIWGLEELNKIVNKHKKKANEIADNLFSLKIENAVTKQVNWEEERKDKIQSLRESYEKGQFSLFLGAGVSSSAGMPDWNTLLNSLFVSYLTKEFNKEASVSDDDIKQIVDRLNYIDEPSALMAARYLRKGLAKQANEIKEFTKTVTENLYKLRDNKKSTDSELIKTISNLCMPRRTGAKVKSVVTYNFDDLLERQLSSNSIMYHSIYNDNDSVSPDELPIYHVHGFLPEDEKKYESLDKSILVFSEEGYHQIYSDSYHWSNLVQLSNLRENNCLMVGLSLTDPNLRRLLDIAARSINSPRHYAFMKRMSIDSFVYTIDENEKKKQVIDNLTVAEDFLNRHHKLNEEIMKELGVLIIWFKSFEEIPEILKKIQ